MTQWTSAWGVSSKVKSLDFVRILHLFYEKGKLLISVGVLDNSPAIVEIRRNKYRISNPKSGFVSRCEENRLRLSNKDLWHQPKNSRRSTEGQMCMFGTHFSTHLRLVTGRIGPNNRIHWKKKAVIPGHRWSCRRSSWSSKVSPLPGPPAIPWVWEDDPINSKNTSYKNLLGKQSS